MSTDFLIVAFVDKANSAVRVQVALFPGSASGKNSDEALINASITLQDGNTLVLGTTSGPLRTQRRSGALILAVTPTINP